MGIVSAPAATDVAEVILVCGMASLARVSQEFVVDWACAQQAKVVMMIADVSRRMSFIWKSFRDSLSFEMQIVAETLLRGAYLHCEREATSDSTQRRRGAEKGRQVMLNTFVK